MMGWNRSTVRDMCMRVRSGGTPSRKKPEYYGGDIPWVKTQEPADGWLTDTSEHLSKEGLASSAAKLLPVGSVLVAMYGATVGKLGILGKEMATNQACCACVPDPNKLDSRFLFYRLLEDRSAIVGRANGAAQQNINVGIVGDLKYSFPLLVEQRGIAATLGALDDKIESNRRVVRNTLDLLDSYSALWGEKLPTIFLEPFASLVEEKMVPSKLQVPVVDLYSLPAFDSGAVPERVAPCSILSTKTLTKGPTIMVSCLNPRIERIWWTVPNATLPALASTEFACLEAANLSELARVWLAVRDKYFIAQTKKRVTGTSGSHQRVRPADLMSIEVPDFRRLSDRNTDLALGLLQTQDQAKCENQKITSLRDALLPELLSGRIRVPEAQAAVTETIGGVAS